MVSRTNATAALASLSSDLEKANRQTLAPIVLMLVGGLLAAAGGARARNAQHTANEVKPDAPVNDKQA